MLVTIENVLSDDAVTALYPTYVGAWQPLLTKAAARHLLTAEEFAKEMNDPRIEKFLVRDDAGQPFALTTLTTDLAVVDWINADYYASRYPDAVARGALFYLGYTLVDQSRRSSGALLAMAAAINLRVSTAKGVVGFDICGYNNAHGIGRHTAWLFGASDRIDTLDTQTYYAADYQGHVVAPASGAGDACSASPADEPTRVVTLTDRPDMAADINGVLASQWPSFMLAGQAGHDVDLPELLLATPDNQILLLDSADTVLGVGLSLPLRWDGSRADLPRGWDDAIQRSARDGAEGTPTNVTCAISITVATTATRRNLATALLSGLKEVARNAGSDTLLAPIRPILKSNYPLTPMADYLTWRTPDGRVFDPWVRLHLRSGGEILGLAPESMVVTGSVEQWQGWLRTSLPGSGEFVIRGGLAPLVVDATSAVGVYREPNVWIAHRLITAVPHRSRARREMVR